MNTRSVFKVVVLAGLLSVTSMSLAAEGVWTRKADMPTARFGLATSVLDGKIYAIGGGTGPGIGVTTVEEYDPATDTWTRKADIHTASAFFSSSVVNGKIYIVGGSASGDAPHLSRVEEYDPATDIWTRRADMPTPRAFLSTGAVNGKIYAIGGQSEEGVIVRTEGVVEEYDPATDTWTRKADMPTPRALMSTSAVDGIIYAIGGCRSQGAWAISTVEAYDPATDTWTSKAPMPTARDFFSTSAVNGKIYAIGGCAHPYNGDTFSSVEAYDPATDTWTKLGDMPTPRKALATSTVNGKIYAIGGNTARAFNTRISTVEEYDTGLAVPTPDLNGDETVNFKDFSMLAQYWYQGQSPFVNHRPDYKDLAVLADYWLKEVLPVSLIAYWRLDETEGFVAHDSAGDHDAFVLSENPLWRPTDGMVNGALELDGIDDFVSAPFVLDPADGAFSIFAWIKGGAAGQVVLSQIGAADWLLADGEGKLMTELKGAGRFAGPLCAEIVITDGQWHRVGLTWDDSMRSLYVDDIEVAADTQSHPQSCSGGLNIGAGNTLDPASFFSGLIDDVRIYDRAIVP